jgi:hypothetical protein
MNTANVNENAISEIDTLNSLLRGELSAVDTYDQAMQKFEDTRLLADLQMIRQEHVEAEVILREKVLQIGGEPVESSEPW